MKAEYVDHMGSDLLVVDAARVSFKKSSDWDFVEAEDADGLYYEKVLNEGDTKLVGYLGKFNHWTPFAHPQITLRIKAPIFIRTQCFKHKVGFTENEVSRRYVDDEPEFFVPEVWRDTAINVKQGSGLGEITEVNGRPLFDKYYWYLHDCLSMYTDMLSAGVAPEQARMVLPQSMYTSWYWTGSLAAYARFCKQRSDPHAQKEIQDLAKMVSDIIEPLFPVSWTALTKE